MSRIRLTAMFPTRQAAETWLNKVRELGLEPPGATLTDATPREKRNGPKLARWLAAHPGWHEIGRAANRSAAYKMAYKINNGERRGFELGGFEARSLVRKGAWIVEARALPKPPRKTSNTDAADMRPLF